MGLGRAIGPGQANLRNDVIQIQQLLNTRANATVVAETGMLDPTTIVAVARFQERELNLRPPSGRVEPDSPTWHALNGQPGAAPETALDTALRALESDSVAFAKRFIQDARVRKNYLNEALRFSAEVRDQVARGELTMQQGAQRATDLRNAILSAGRLHSSDLGRAVAEAEKATGRTLDNLVELYADRFFRRPFSQLTAAQQDRVFAEIILASGRPNLRYTNIARNLGRVGKGLFIVSLAFASYEIVRSDRPGRETARQGVGIGAGIGGSIAGGALAGLACGPGAPICVGIGAFVGGIAFAVGADVTFTRLWR